MSKQSKKKKATSLTEHLWEWQASAKETEIASQSVVSDSL